MAFVDLGSSASSSLQQRLRATVQDGLTSSGTPGAAVALLLDGQPVLTDAIGWRDWEQTTALDSHAQFYIYSVTKSLIATALLQHVQRGTIALDAPIQSYLVDVPLVEPVTVRQLLNHTGGIPDYGGLPAYSAALRADPTRAWTPDQFLAATLPRGLTFAPGQGWAYSNIGFLLLRQLIEAVTHTSLADALHQQIFAPLELQQTFVAQTLADAHQLTPGYSTFLSGDDTVEDVHALYHPGWVSHGVVISTAPELARMIDAIFSGTLLDAPSRAAMLEPVRVPVTHHFFQQPSYGLGLMIDPQSRYGLLAGHGGGGPGYTAGVIHLPDVRGHRVTSVVLTNRDQDDLSLRTAFTLALLLADTLVR